MGLTRKHKQARRHKVKVSLVSRPPGAVNRKRPSHAAVFTRRSRRLAIAYYYVHALGSPPAASWPGRQGTVATIRRTFKIPLGSSTEVRNVLIEVQRCLRAGIQYDGDFVIARNPRRRVVPMGSLEAQIIADSVENCTCC